MLPHDVTLTARPSEHEEENLQEQVLGQKLLQAWQHVAHGQHPNGEIVAFRRDQDGNYQYVRSPFVSTFVHDALGCFDPASPFFRPGSLGLLPQRRRVSFVREVVLLRQRIRSFLAWQQEAEGWWRFFGRGSGIDPDVSTTVNAAVALLERQSRHWQARERLQESAVRRFRAPDGRYYTFLKLGRGGYGWMDEKGRPVAGFDRVVNADVLRYLSLTTGPGTPEREALTRFVKEEIALAAWQEGTPLFPKPVSFAYSVSRAWRQGRLPEVEAVRAGLLPAILSPQEQGGGFGGPLTTAFTVATLLRLNAWDTPLHSACRYLLWLLGQDAAPLYEDFVVDGFGSPALTAALIMDCLVIYHTLDEEGDA